MSEKFENPIDPDKITETPSTLEYGHHLGSPVIKPEDQGKLQMDQIRQQMQLLADQAKKLNSRKVISEIIYAAEIRFEPLINHTYHLYQKEDSTSLLSLIAPDQWGRSKKTFSYIATVRLLADHTWDVIEKNEDFEF
jgi:hypothetical protein